MKIHFRLTTWALLAATTLPLAAQSEGDSLMLDDQELEAIEVVAKSKARKLQEQAYAISVIDLKNRYTAASPLNKVLNTVTSVRVREDGGVGSNYTFAMNGFSGNQVKFFLDGIPMDNFGSSFNLANFSANIAERVEVYKGVLPVSLGADALGGAVNIVTRVNANYLEATYSVGSFNTHKVSLAGAYTNTGTGFTFRANAFFNYSDNDYKVYAPIVDLSTGRSLGDAWVKRFNDAYYSAGLKMETGVIAKPWADQLLVGVILSGNDKHIQTGATMDAVYGRVKSRSYSLIPTLRYKKTNLFTPGLDLSLYATYNVVNTYNVDTAAVDYNWLGESVPSTSRGEGYLTDALIKERQWQANANLNYLIDDHQSVTLNHIVTSMDHKQNDREYPEYSMNDRSQYLTKEHHRPGLPAPLRPLECQCLRKDVFPLFLVAQAHRPVPRQRTLGTGERAQTQLRLRRGGHLLPLPLPASEGQLRTGLPHAGSHRDVRRRIYPEEQSRPQPGELQEPEHRAGV